MAQDRLLVVLLVALLLFAEEEEEKKDDYEFYYRDYYKTCDFAACNQQRCKICGHPNQI